MKLLFSFRSDEYDLPPALNIFEFIRALYQCFTEDPYGTYKIIEKNVVPMGQLKNGIFISFKDNPQVLFDKFLYRNKADHLKLEMSVPIPGLIRVEASNLSKQPPIIIATIWHAILESLLPFRISSDQLF